MFIAFDKMMEEAKKCLDKDDGGVATMMATVGGTDETGSPEEGGGGGGQTNAAFVDADGNSCPEDGSGPQPVCGTTY